MIEAITPSPPVHEVGIFLQEVLTFTAEHFDTEEHQWLDFVARNTPDEVRLLGRLAGTEGLRLVDGFDADDVGLVVSYPVQAEGYDASHALGEVVTLDLLDRLASARQLTRTRRPGWFACLVINGEHARFGWLIPPGRDDFEREVS